MPAHPLLPWRADVHSNGSGDAAVRARVSATLFPDLLLDIHEAFLDPSAEMGVGAYGVGIQHLGEGGFDLLIDLAELVRVFQV